MKIAEAILVRILRNKAERDDAFERRLENLGTQITQRSRTPLPTLFVRAHHA
ncbi:MAG: hypothetical protein H6895_13890 [Defluviimonas sp.]|uniref:hypothetical protein n=1 Tax=Albidovulum sp. TaxID=1872424 RepID=UPI001D6BF375|nr:hypothetical protein [Paracoccaceae bacterium]MCC0065155.1 hypothetical protein [Defluviimonas sp.]